MSPTCLSLYVSVLPSKELARHPNIAVSQDLLCIPLCGTGLVRSGRARSPDRHDLTPKFALEVPMSDNA